MKTNFKFKIVAVAILAGLLAGTAQGFLSFTLTDNQYLLVDNTQYDQGTLYNNSRVNIVSGYVGNITAYDHSSVDISGGGATQQIRAFGYSSVHQDGGYATWLIAGEHSVVNIGGYADSLGAYDSSTLNITGEVGVVLYAQGSSTVNISGGNINCRDGLFARDSTVVTFYGQNFLLGEGLSNEGGGRRLSGIGTLSGEWMNGTPWTVNISENAFTATILIPEPATLCLLGLGGLALLRKRRA